MQIWDWIDHFAAATIVGPRVVLFGAGRGSEEFLNFSSVTRLPIDIIGVVDNDRSCWGKSFMGLPIHSPAKLRTMAFDTIVVSSVSGREAIARQLRAMGYAEGHDFVRIGCYPSPGGARWLTAIAALPESLQGKHCLHIGPGGFLGFEMLLHAMGATTVSAVDLYSFNMRYPDITARYPEYKALEGLIAAGYAKEAEQGRALQRFQSLFMHEEGSVRIDPRAIAYHCPMDVCDLSFLDARFDMVFSFAVLEHVRRPAAAAGEIARVLKPGGYAWHYVVNQDHRSFSKVPGFGPFSLRSYSCEEWEHITHYSFYQNRLLPVEWKELFAGYGLEIINFEIEKTIPIDAATLHGFHPDFLKFSQRELEEVNFSILCRK